MKISKTTVKFYLDHVMVVYFGDHNQPPEDLSDYDENIENMRIIAQKAGDLPWLKLALQYLLSHPEINLRDYRGSYPFQPDQVRAILIHIWGVLWPGSEVPGPGEGANVELVDMSVEEWADMRRHYAGER
jgi:hypothetical protein